MAHLYTEFQAVCKAAKPTPVICTNSADMLVRGNFEYLRIAIQNYTTHDKTDDLKSSLKNALYFLILKLGKIQKAIYLVNNNDNQAAEIDKWRRSWTIVL